MTPSKKLFIAAMLLAAGYGVASLLGAPDLRLQPDTSALGGPAPSNPVTAAPLSAAAPAGPSIVGSVRLLPESSAASLDRLGSADGSAAATANSTAPPQFVATSPVVETPAALIAEPSSPLLTARPVPLPRATLKNEAPRPFPATDRPATPSPASPVAAADNAWQAANGPTSPSNNVFQAGFAADAVAPATPAIRATNATPIQPIPETRPLAPVSPPPWPMAEVAPLRTHVIVDGDSLAKLAGRYLDDPRRSEEIFALNRGLLSDPELLPIGTELKIPPRGSAGEAGGPMPHSQLVGTAVHAAEHTGLVPVRSLPATSGVMPRAQLLPPRPVE